MSDTAEQPEFHWMNLLSLRVIFVSLVFALIVGTVLSLIWQPLIYIAYPLFFLVWVAQGFSTPVKCPKCSKRQKMGSPRCHHCGYDSEIGATP